MGHVVQFDNKYSTNFTIHPYHNLNTGSCRPYAR